MKKFLLLLLLLFTSCRTQYVVMPSSHTRDSLHVSSDHRYDSIYIDRYHTEKLHRGSDPVCSYEGTTSRSSVCSYGGTTSRSSVYSYGGTDTLVVRDSIYIERWRINTRVDTIQVTTHDSIPYPVEVPIEVEKPIPRFYRTCTLGFFLLLIALIAFIALRLYLRR